MARFYQKRDNPGQKEAKSQEMATKKIRCPVEKKSQKRGSFSTIN